MKRGLLILCLLATAASLHAEEAFRFAPPEFEQAYTEPVTTTPPARAPVFAYIDVGLLALALGLTTWAVLRKRSRRHILLLSVVCLVYFGFIRKGCVCSVGSLQNIAYALAHEWAVLPLGVLLFFLLPLAVALYAGRAFCATACPLGAMQELVLLKPLRVPPWLDTPLRGVAWVYLAAAVLFAATGAGFLICRYDPFVAFFRLSGSRYMLTAGACVLFICLFVGRAYCRYLCPYGVLLGLCASVSKWRVSITPDTCIHCRLCEDACPYGAIRAPETETPHKNIKKKRRTMLILVLLLPAWSLLGGWLGHRMGPTLAEHHPTVIAIRAMPAETMGNSETAHVLAIAKRFTSLSTILGAILGLAFGLKLVSLSRYRQQPDYEADRAHCFQCGRCYEYCPQEHARRRGEAKRI